MMGYSIDNLPAIHPGRLLRDELHALGLGAAAFGARIRVPEHHVTEILDGERGISADMAIRLGLAFGTTAQYWMNLQVMHDLKVARAAMPAEVLRIEAYAPTADRRGYHPIGVEPGE